MLTEVEDVFSPPGEVSDEVDVDFEGALASLGQRLAGVLVDAAISVGVFIPGVLIMLVLGGPDEVEGNPFAELGVALPVLIGLVAQTGVNWWLIATQGQSIGKWAVGTRIVRLNGEPAGFFYGVVLRNFVLAVPTGVLNQCCLGWVITLVDGLMIFGPERRCLHDQIAGTVVVRAEWGLGER